MNSRKIKCVVWDLDNTLWNGVLLEDDRVTLKNDVVEVIKILDERGIIHSIASRNDYSLAVEQLKKMDLYDYFLYPQICWDNKSSSVKKIADALNIGMDSLAFVDDQTYERDEVNFVFSEVLTYDIDDIKKILILTEFKPKFITEDTKRRREFYQLDLMRKKTEDAHVGSHEDFLSSLDMSLNITKASESDLKRAEELTIRTNQLNTTGITYSFDELNDFMCSPHHELLIAELKDKYGDYGKLVYV